VTPGLVRTLRIRSRRKAGGLGVVTTALGDAGASIGEISTLKIGHNYTLRDFDLLLDDEEHLASVLESIAALADSEVIEVIDSVREVHKGGKIRTRSRIDLTSLSALNSGYMPGVKDMVRAIDDDPKLADTYTSVQRTVAIVTDGAGLAGFGKVEPRSMLPVLEGKAALLASMAGLSSLPLVLAVDSEDDFIETVTRIAPSCGAILLDALAAPRGQRAYQKLSERLALPIFHDDADGPAIAGLAAVINTCQRAGLDLARVTIGQIGLGTAGGAIARLIMRHTERPVLGEDVHPAAVSRHVSAGGRAASLEEIMQKCDVVVANTGHANVIPASLVREGQAIIALSEPRPEIEPYDAQLAGAAFAADGKAVNTAVVFPGVLLGALAVRATQIDDRMRIAAALTMAEAAEDGDLVPTPLSDRIHARVALAVARAAVRSGRARRPIDESELTLDVFEELIHDERMLPLRT
jgi:malate dehydrogenase (oxaloacetate-decarboxylating)